MRLAAPRWWYVRQGAPLRVTRTLAKPISWVWSYATARRIARGRPIDPGPPVICVGNLTMGGSGKTPVVRAIVSRLASRGVRAQVLSRGYGGRLSGPVRVDPKMHEAKDVGDEALMLAGDAPVWVSRDRAAGAVAAAGAGAQAIVMDDGHQNPALRKALSLIVVDAETRGGEWPFGDGAIFPAGPMREPFAAGLARADAVVLLLPADLATPDPALCGLFGSKPTLTAHLQPAAVRFEGPIVGFAGIAKPWKMERALQAAGLDLVDFADFPDHGRFSERQLEFLQSRAAKLGARLLTSEKDWIRLPPDWRRRIAFWPVAVQFDDEPALDAFLERAVRRAS